MKIGAAQVEITPKTHVDLSGFASRTQPMTGVLDPIFAKAIFLSQGNQKLLWVDIEALALGAAFVQEFRDWAMRVHAIGHVLLSATHTHSAPATVVLTGCGRLEAEFLKSLQLRAQEAAHDAIARAEPGEVCFAQTELKLAIDRRNKPSAHVDSLLSGVGLKRPNGEFIAAILNYPMHPVALGHVNRSVSGDWCSAAADGARKALPGNPMTLITNGACGNINPPKRPVEPPEVRALGEQVVRAIVDPMKQARPTESPHALRIAIDHVDLPLDWMPPDAIDTLAAGRIDDFANTAWATPFREAITTWRDTQKALVSAGAGRTIDIELFAIDLGPLTILAISGELFSRFTAMLRERVSKPLIVVGYANAVFGYIPTREAYAEGGYEVNDAHFFYNSFRPKEGGLELLVERAAKLLAAV